MGEYLTPYSGRERVGGTPASQPPGGRLCIGPSPHPNTHKFPFPQFPPIVRFGNILLGVGGIKYFLTV